MRLRKKLAKIYNTVIFYLLVNNNHDPIWLQKYICNKILIQTFRLRDKKTPLHFAVIQNNKAAVEYLINNDVNIDSIDKNGNTALHYAAKFGYQDLVSLLLNSGADDSVKNKNNFTYLHFIWKNKIKKALQDKDLEGASYQIYQITNQLKVISHINSKTKNVLQDMIDDGVEGGN